MGWMAFLQLFLKENDTYFLFAFLNYKFYFSYKKFIYNSIKL